MIDNGALRLICTALFVFAGSYCAYRLVRGHSIRSRIDHGFHLMMCVAMVAMAWPAGLAVPLLPQGVLFVVATIWFALGAARGKTLNVYYAAMMAAMVWMIAVMAGWLPGAAAHDHAGGGDAAGSAGGPHAMHDMAGMDMASHSDAAAGSPGWIGATSQVLTVFFAAAAVTWLYTMFRSLQSYEVRSTPQPGAVATLRPASTVVATGLACEVAMAAGMAIMMATM